MYMKIALCFIISYEHILNKENIWYEWIKHNKDIINVYFYYKDYNKIKSSWMKQHAIPSDYIYETSYFHVVPAYLSLMRYARKHDSNNEWFCFLTESCCPIISPKRFRYIFYKYYNKSIFSWRTAWWNVELQTRANLKYIPTDYRLANDPWFVLNKRDTENCIMFFKHKSKIVDIVCKGGIANESIFAIVLYIYKQLDNAICSASHAADWSRMASSTSPHLFKNADHKDILFIEKTLKDNKFTMFIRKISTDFPDEVINKYIYEYSKQTDHKLYKFDPFLIDKIFHTIMSLVFLYFFYFLFNRFSIVFHMINK
jgi:hypothetical protein